MNARKSEIRNPKSKIIRPILWAAGAITAAVVLGALLMGVARGVVPTTSDAERFACNGTTTAFVFHFGVWNTSEVEVQKVTNATGAALLLTESSDYTVTLPNDDGWLTPGGTVTTATAYSSAYTLVIARLPILEQQSDYSTAESVDLESIEDDFDKAAVRDRYLQRLIRRSLRTASTDLTDVNLGTAAERASSTFTWNANGSPAMVAGLVSPNDVTVTALWKTLLTQTTPAASLTALGLEGATGAELLDLDAAVDAAWWDPNGDGVQDDRGPLQRAIDYAVANHRTLLIRRPSVAYRIDAALQIGTGTAVTYGLDIVGVGQPKILWGGAASGTVLNLVSLAESRITNLRIDGNDVSGVTGIHAYCEPTFPGQRITLRGLMVQNCPLYGVRLTQDANATCDYFTFDAVDLSYNGINLRIEGDIRQVDYRAGSILNAGSYGVQIASGQFKGYGTFFGRSTTADIHLASNLAGLSLFDSTHESNEVLVTSGTASSYSPVTAPIELIRVRQDLYVSPWTAPTAIDYNSYKSLLLEACMFVGDVNIGTSALSVVSLNTEFVPIGYSGITGSFTGQTAKVIQIGRGTDGYANLFAGPLTIAYSPPWPRGPSLSSLAGDYTQTFVSSNEEPNAADPEVTYYRRGDWVMNFWPTAGSPMGWTATADGSFNGVTPATFHAMAPLGWLTGAITWDPSSLTDGTGQTSSAITVTGAAAGDYVLVAPPYDLQDCTATGYVQAANTVEIRLQNESGGTRDLGSGAWRVRLIKP